MSRVVATVGAIPGAGATTVVTALGSALAEQRSHVALVDASAPGSRIADVLELEGGGELADALRRRADLSDVQAAGPHGLHAFPATPETNWTAVRPGAVATTYERLRDRFEVVLVDCGNDLSPAAAAWIGYADELVVVTCPDVDDAADETAALGSAFDVPVRGVLANRVAPDERDATFDTLEASPYRPLGLLPEDPAVDAAASERRSLLMHEPDSQIASCVWEFGQRFAEADHAEPILPDAWTGLTATAERDTRAAGETAAGDSSAAETAGDTNTDDLDETASGQAATPDGGTGTDAAVTSEDETSDPGTSAVDAPSADAAADDPADGDGSSAGAATAESGTDDAESAFEWSSSDDLDGDDGVAPDDTLSTGDEAPDSDDGSANETDRSSSLDAEIDADLDASSDESHAADRGSVADGGREPSAPDAGAESPGDEPEVSDEEIEAAFKETMQQAKAERDAAADEEPSSDGGEADHGEDDEDDDSVLGGFMGN